MKLLTVIGARPQFIKASVVSRVFRHCESSKETIVHTGQHFDANMSDVFFDELDIPKPNYNLGIGGGTHGQNTGRMIEAIETLLLKEKPDCMMVYGDTDSTLAGALAAIKLHVPVAHVEAGLRSFNREMPEEINRVLTDNIASKLFAPTATAVKNLAAEGITGERVCNVGDVMYDAALYYGIMAEKTSRILDDCGVKDKSYILATLHRQENVDNRTRLANILIGLSYSDKPVIMPLHPRTRKRLLEFNLTVPSIIKVIDPIGYLDMVMLQKHASLIATDSGGLQKEAYFHKIPCITLRDETEWVELVELGVNLLVGADAALIANSLNYHVKKSCYCENFYGTGQTGTAITSNLVNS